MSLATDETTPSGDSGAQVWESYLQGGWRDTLTIIGALAILLAAWQLWRTVSASRAAIKSLDQSRQQYNKYVIAQASRLLSDATFCARKRDWSLAALRLGDLGDLLLQIAHDDESWGTLAVRLHKMESTFSRLAAQEVHNTPSLEGKWLALQRAVRKKIAEQVGPFNTHNEE